MARALALRKAELEAVAVAHASAICTSRSPRGVLLASFMRAMVTLATGRHSSGSSASSCTTASRTQR